MLSARELNDVKFSEARKGYDVTEVDELLEKISADYLKKLLNI